MLFSVIKRLITGKPLLIIFSCLIVILLLIGFISIRIGQAYRQRIDIKMPQHIKEEEEKKLKVKKIKLRRGQGDDAECLEIGLNGSIRKYDCVTLEIIEQGFLGFDQVDSFFTRFNLSDFENLKEYYVGGDSFYTITIETNQGTKTITIEPGEGDVPDDLEDLIDDIEEEEENIFNPTPTPSSSSLPSPTPVPSSTPTPSPTNSPTPSPVSSPSPGASAEPFSCSMISGHSKAITVSNIVCLPEE